MRITVYVIGVLLFYFVAEASHSPIDHASRFGQTVPARPRTCGEAFRGLVWTVIVLTFTGSLSLAASGREAARTGGTNGIAPGYEVSLTYKRVALSTQGEYVFDTGSRSGNFFYTWSTLTYSPRNWFRGGLVEQRTQAYHTPLDVQRGILAGFSYKQVEFTTYIFDFAVTDPTVVLEFGVSY